MVFPVVVAEDKAHLTRCIFDAMIVLGNRCSLNFIDVSNIEDMSHLFSTTLSKFNGDISQWNTKNLKYAEAMFQGSAFTGNLSKWDVSSLRDADRMFESAICAKGVEKWNVSNLVCGQRMFAHIQQPPDIRKWRLKRCIGHFQMFTLPVLLPTDLPEDISFEYMFGLKNQDLDQQAWFSVLRNQPIGVLHFFSALYFPGTSVHPGWKKRHQHALNIASTLYDDPSRIAIQAVQLLKRQPVAAAAIECNF